MTPPTDGRTSAINRWWKRFQDWRFGAIDPAARIGLRGEQAAARFLRQKGYTVVAHGETDRAGEIDLIAVDRRRKLVVFVEVKTLATSKPGHPADRVDADKQARITRAALRFLGRHQLLDNRCRFDVVAIWWVGNTAEPQAIEHYEAAFEACGVDGFYS